MTTLGDARTELAAAIAAAGVPVDTSAPPTVRIVFRGMATGSGAVRGQSPATFGIVALGGAWDSAAASAELADTVGTILSTVRALASWGLGDASGERILRVDGSDFVAAEITAVRMIDY